MSGDQELSGPDLQQGVALDDLEDGQPFLGHATGEAVLLVRRGDEVHAVSAACTHWGGPLAEGLVDDDEVHCPWHHACYSLRTGEALGAPAMNPLARWDVEIDDGTVRVTGKQEADPLEDHGRHADGPESVVIIGAGAAGAATTEMLRRQGYDGRVVLVDPEETAPYDRPNLSKDYLAGNAPEEWIPLRSADFWREHDVQRVVAEAEAIATDDHTVALSNGDTVSYGALVLATGAQPVRLDVPGADAAHVHVLRSLDDSRSIIAAAKKAERAVVVGASFIGMEVAAALRARDVHVDVVAPEHVPFARTLGEKLGRWVQSLHEDHGVAFHLGRTVSRIEDSRVLLDDRTELPADLVVVGIGVRPDVRLAEAAGLEVDDGVVVDEYFRSSAPDVYAVGDIARYPDPRTGERIRLEHWVVAERQGQAVARTIAGRGKPFTDTPFFWTDQYDVPIAYVGYARTWDAIELDGKPGDGDFEARFLADDVEMAHVSYFRDHASLEMERKMRRAAERKLAAGLG
ncbi:MAG: FAD-dependent oxidoreductase [Gemmatimonadota bacterium]|jgi:NADPH-dependent 2,4-dienoyl-CoA reductase/sulfur reductase-like enzyme/nitrite reductase/ring-hydroxylating ferredoxin subunit